MKDVEEEGKRITEGNKKLYEYFVKNYISNNKVKYWNVSNEEDRTNNTCESLNRVLNLFFKKRIFHSNTTHL